MLRADTPAPHCPGLWNVPSHDSAEVRWPPGLASWSRAAGSVPLLWGLRHGSELGSVPVSWGLERTGWDRFGK